MTGHLTGLSLIQWLFLEQITYWPYNAQYSNLYPRKSCHVTNLHGGYEEEIQKTLNPQMPRVFKSFLKTVPEKCLLHRAGWVKSCWIEFKYNAFRDFPCGVVVKNLLANAGDTGSSPGLGRSHMPWSNWAPVPQLLKPVCLEPVLCDKRSQRSEKPTHRNEE